MFRPAQAVTDGSMRLHLTGAKTHDQAENIVPYSLYGDGDLNGESLPVGEYTLAAAAYSEAQLSGNLLGTLEVSLRVTGPVTQQTNTPATGARAISGTDRWTRRLRQSLTASRGRPATATRWWLPREASPSR